MSPHSASWARPAALAGLLSMAALALAAAAAAVPDLQVAVGAASPTTDGAAGVINVTLTNAGSTASGPTTTNLTVDGAGLPDLSFGALTAGNSETQSVPITWVCGRHTVAARADAPGSVAESDEGNNNASTTVSALANASFTFVRGGELGTYNLTVAAGGAGGCGSVAYTWNTTTAGNYTGQTATFIVPAGNVSVRLRVTPADPTLEGESTQEILIPNEAPRFQSIGLGATVATGTPIGLLILALDLDGSVDIYEVNFGNGNNTTDLGNVTEFRYPQPGNFTITIRITDNLGATNETTRAIRVTNRGPTAEPTLDFVYADVGDRVVFNATPSRDPEGGPLTYHWDFGDGTTADGAIANHTYAARGSFTAELTVTDEHGATDAVTIPVTVLGPADDGNPQGPLLALALGILVVAVLFFIVRIRGRPPRAVPPPKEAPPPPPPGP